MITTGLARLGRDAEIRYLQDGTAVCNLSLAYNYGMKPKDGGNKPTQWVDGTVWGKMAEALAPYLKKGGLIDVVLEDLHIEEFEGKNGPGHKLAARVLKIELAGSKDGGSAGASDGAQQQPQQQRPAATHPAARPAAAPANTGGGFGEFDDDIPF
jgi:single-strand DNA-binding protein